MWNNARLLERVANGLYVVTACVLLFAALSWLTHRSYFSLQNIRVEAATKDALQHINAPTIRANLVGRLQGNFFTVNLDAARQSIETLPWVRSVSVRREWPNGLIMSIEEHKVLATWGHAESTKLMNTFGEVFVANTAEVDDEKNLLKFAGPDGSSKEVLAKYGDLQTWLSPLGLKVKELSLSDRYSWHSKLSNGMQLELGREQSEIDKTSMGARVKRFVSAWPQVIAKWGSGIEYADLRYPHGFALRAAGMKFLPETAVKVPRPAEIER